jgi:hypothetical protein
MTLLTVAEDDRCGVVIAVERGCPAVSESDRPCSSDGTSEGEIDGS